MMKGSKSSDDHQWSPEFYAKHRFVQRHFNDKALDNVKELLQQHGSNDITILDLGCGDGETTIHLAELALAVLPRGVGAKRIHVVGVDNSAAMIERAQHRLAALPSSLQAAENQGWDIQLSFEQGDVEALNFQQRFDLVTSFNCLHWVVNEAAGHLYVLEGIANALKAGGGFCLSFHGKDSMAEIIDCISAVCCREKWVNQFKGMRFPFGLYSPSEYQQWLPLVGLEATLCRLDRMLVHHPGAEGLVRRLKVGWLPWTARAGHGDDQSHADTFSNAASTWASSSGSADAWAHEVAEEFVARHGRPEHLKSDAALYTPTSLMRVVGRKPSSEALANVFHFKGKELRVGVALEQSKWADFGKPLQEEVSSLGMQVSKIPRSEWSCEEVEAAHDVVLYKLKPNDGSPFAATTPAPWARRIQRLADRQRALVIDAPKNHVCLDDRDSMAKAVDEGLGDLYPRDVRSPITLSFLVEPSEAELASAISDAGLTYPVFVKPQSGAAHEGMSMVSGEARLLPALRAAGYPAVIQEYVPHGGVLFKVCVIGPRIYIKQMGSVSDSNSDEVIDVGRVSKLEADRSLYATPPFDIIETACRRLTANLGLNMYNVDWITHAHNGTHVIIDINPFPGFTQVPQRFLAVGYGIHQLALDPKVLPRLAFKFGHDAPYSITHSDVGEEVHAQPVTDLDESHFEMPFHAGYRHAALVARAVRKQQSFASPAGASQPVLPYEVVKQGGRLMLQSKNPRVSQCFGGELAPAVGTGPGLRATIIAGTFAGVLGVALFKWFTTR